MFSKIAKEKRMNKKTLVAVITVFAMLLTACNKNGSDPSNSEGNSSNAESPSTSDTKSDEGGNSFFSENIANQDIWELIPEFPAADESTFEYSYNSEIEGMEITYYLKESPKLHIPETLEGEPVKSVDLSNCNKELTQLVMPDSVVRFALSEKTMRSLQYLGVPNDAMDYNAAIKYRPDRFEGVSEDEFYQNALKSGNNSFSSYEHLMGIGLSGKSLRYKTIDGMLFYKHSNEFILLFCPPCKHGNLTLPDGLTGIRPYSFSGCTKLVGVSIPESVTAITNDVFNNCSQELNITYKGNTYAYTRINDLYLTINYGEDVASIQASYTALQDMAKTISICAGSAYSIVIMMGVVLEDHTVTGEKKDDGSFNITLTTVNGDIIRTESVEKFVKALNDQLASNTDMPVGARFYIETSKNAATGSVYTTDPAVKLTDPVSKVPGGFTDAYQIGSAAVGVCGSMIPQN